MAEFTGNGGADLLRGRDEGDVLRGLGGRDRLLGGRGRDALNGGDDIDILRGGDSSDSLFGGAGDDILFGHGDGGRDPEAGAIAATRVANGLDRPVFATAAPGDPGHLYVGELRTGDIRILDIASGTIAPTPFLDLDNARLGSSGEQGFLGFAFHPDFEDNRQLFVSLTNPAGETEILRFETFADDPTRVDPASETLIWTFPRNPEATNHGGGWIDFGPDGYLYIASGDGGPGNDPNNEAQDTGSFLGKILRIDVDGDDFPDDPDRNYAIPEDNPFADGGGAAEVWAFGLRNPWRNSFDSATGDFYIADVGQARFEEVNWQPASSGGGENYGWVVKEGYEVRRDDRPGNPSPEDPSLVDPVHVYAHSEENGVSVTGGYVYRGPSAGMDGFYIFGDFGSSRIATFRIQDGQATDFTNLGDRIVTNAGSIGGIVSFAVDAADNLYVLAFSGQIYRLDPSPGAADGDDLVRAGAGDDSAYGGAGFDRLHGDDGADRLFGGLGEDRLFGGAGTDRLAGDDGADRLEGGAEADMLRGGAGDDLLVGGAGDDDSHGGAGIDTLIFAPGDGNDRFRDFQGNDRIDLRAFDFADAGEALGHGRSLGNGNVVFRFDGAESLIVADTTLEQLAGQILI